MVLRVRLAISHVIACEGAILNIGIANRDEDSNPSSFLNRAH